MRNTRKHAKQQRTRTRTRGRARPLVHLWQHLARDCSEPQSQGSPPRSSACSSGRRPATKTPENAAAAARQQQARRAPMHANARARSTPEAAARPRARACRSGDASVRSYAWRCSGLRRQKTTRSLFLGSWSAMMALVRRSARARTIGLSSSRRALPCREWRVSCGVRAVHAVFGACCSMCAAAQRQGAHARLEVLQARGALQSAHSCKSLHGAVLCLRACSMVHAGGVCCHVKRWSFNVA